MSNGRRRNPKAYEGFQGKVEQTLARSEPWWPPSPPAPPGAPNVIVMLVDDMGFSDLGCYGSEIDTPNLDRLAAEGIRFSNFHATPLCAPTRAALLTGLNHHNAGVGAMGDDMGFPGYRTHLAENTLTMAEIFRANGYSTFHVGKWHLAGITPREASNQNWPIQRGFDRHYGFLDGFTTYHSPLRLTQDNTFLDIDNYPDGYFLNDDLTDRAIAMIRTMRAADHARPFFLYFAHFAPHFPLQAKAKDVEKYRWAYEAGWDEVRARRHRRQQEIGVIPQGTKLSPRTSEPGHEVQPWDSLSEKEKTLFARYMECYAGLVDNVDQNFGRLRGALEEMGEWNNTIVVFLSDNGASENGLHIGASNCFKTGAVGSPGIPEGLAAQVDEDYKWLEEMGGPRTYPQYPRGWAMVSNTPFRLYKGNTHAGGHQVPLIVSWPAKRLESGGIRRQYTYVTDVLPTLIDLIGLHKPTGRNGRVVKPIQGESFAPLLQDAEAPSRHTEQYYEIRSSRAYYRDGWEAVILYRRRTRLSEQSWELFDITSDPTQLNDLSSERPEKVRELADAWDKAAWENQVYPLDERVGLKWLLREAGMGPPGPMVLGQGAPTLHYATHVIAERSFSIAVDLDYNQGDEGVLVAHGHQGCGFVIYIELGRLTFAYNWFGNMREMDGGAVPPGAREIALHAQAMGNSLWTMGLAVDGETTAGEEFRMFGDQVVHQSLDIGIDRCSPVSWDLHERHGNFRYNGTLHSVTMTPGPRAPDRDPEQVRQRLLEEARKLE